ncbi:MAG: hypothetical protein CM1200mP29_14420 [Verrucomicrobiota bacterium]|nr:MAG: hypothetical protein CM1200mP29_14420 [Verrucomicrobiota bacterium]
MHILNIIQQDIKRKTLRKQTDESCPGKPRNPVIRPRRGSHPKPVFKFDTFVQPNSNDKQSHLITPPRYHGQLLGQWTLRTTSSIGLVASATNAPGQA